MNLLTLRLFLYFCLLAFNVNAQADTKAQSKIGTKIDIKAAQSSTKPDYQQYPATQDGIGKVYMGREIAQVMGYQGAAWLERESREHEERTDILLRALNLKTGMQVADVGAGTGYLSRRMADSVGLQGTIYAVDVQSEMIGKLKSLAKSYSNIKPVLSTPSDVKLTENSLDMAVLVDVYHELEFPFEVTQSIWAALKPGAKLVLVEYRAEDDRVPIKTIHKMTQAQVIKEITVLPFQWHNTVTSLPWQHVIVFTKQ
jgi:2-polyprenyl-3-methyl-5-hydroxy-6-metoxy-1,4-benzoquinol methylase